jgi:hypothetical protein
MQPMTNADALIASLPAKVRALLNLKGQVISLQIGRPAKMRQKVESSPVYKFSKLVCRVGIDYSNIAAVKEKQSNGTLPSETQPRSWGTYVVFPYVIFHRDQLYFHFSTFPSNNKTEVVWVRDNKVVDIEEVKRVCLASETFERETTLDCFDLAVEHILEINGVPV